MRICGLYLNVPLCIAALCIGTASCGKKQEAQSAVIDSLDWARAEAEANAHMEEVLASMPDSDSDEQFAIANPWRIEYLHDEWGDDDTSYPFLSTSMLGTAWNVRIDYMPPTSQNPNGLFRLMIVDEEGHVEDMFGPVEILVRGSDEETRAVEVTGIQDSIVFIEDPATVKALKHYLNSESFDLLLKFEKYNERHSTRARWWSTEGYFQRAIDTML